MEKNKQYLEEVKEAYKKFDEMYEEAEISPYGAAYRYFEAGADFINTKLEDEHNNYLRALADSENIKKNFAKKQSDLYAYRYEPIMTELLDILDDIDRGNKNNAFTEGGSLIMTKLCNTLSKFDLVKIVPNKGDEFDSDIMEATGVISMGDDLANKVIDCCQVGYKYNGKIIRYPKVIVGS